MRLCHWLALCGTTSLLAAAAHGQPSFVAFESGPVRPLALSGTALFATNTPDNRLEIFEIGPAGPVHTASVPVGMEPVAVAVRTPDEVWVVNQLSDSVSIVDVPSRRVKQTLLVGDEPSDIVFAAGRAFITTAHRGQHRTDPSISGVTGAGDPQFTTQGVGRADVWVFDGASPGALLGGVPLKIIQLFGDTPRALAVDGNTVYAAVFKSGNQTTTVTEGAVCNGFGGGTCGIDGVVSPGGLPGGLAPGGNPGPATNFAGAPAPEVGLVVKWNEDDAEWQDELGRNWSNGVRFHLPDKDVFAIDATTLNETAFVPHVGTTIFNMAVNPVSGTLYVSNLEARNEVRFEGPGSFGGSTVQGRLAETRITVISGGTARPRHLNRHIPYGSLPAPVGTADHSLSTPLDTIVSSDGSTLYVAAFGSSKVGVLSTAALEDDSLWDDAGAEFDPTVASAAYLDVSGGGPAGLALDEGADRLYVLTRFDNSLSVLDTVSGDELAHIPLHNPEPASITEGRPFLYDAAATSSNGEASCASCHIFGDMDQLAWDLGNPDEVVTSDPIPIKLESEAPGNINGTGNPQQFHPMKGPMTTQTLKGLANHGAMHWRGDRANGFFGIDAFDEDLSFRNFIVAFEGLVGKDGTISGADMQKFTDFALQMTLPPNPVRSFDNSLTGAQSDGEQFFLGEDGSDAFGPHRADGFPPFTGDGFTCEGCHTLAPSLGFFGADGGQSFENEPQIVKVAHLRNLYQKVGMFGMPNVSFFLSGDSSHKGDQVRGFGYLHDGSTDTIFRFLRADVFDHQDFVITDVGFFGGDNQRRDVEQFLLAFDSDLPPIVGQQVTIDATNVGSTWARLNLMLFLTTNGYPTQILGSNASHCDLIAKATLGGTPAGFFYRTDLGLFMRDDGTTIADVPLRQLSFVPGQEITYTCVPFGSGQRMGIDRDEDGALDAVDNCPTVANLGQANSDGDLHGDACDNCMLVANADQCDTNRDGFGNVCDGDYNNDGGVSIPDLSGFLLPGINTAVPPGNPDLDQNCDGAISIPDLSGFFLPAINGPPGPSGLACAGTDDCVTP